MVNNLIFTGALAVGTEKYAPFSADAWAEAGQMTLLGMLMVFAVLGTLWAVLTVFKLAFVGRAPKNKAPKKKISAEKSDEPTIIAMPGAAPFSQPAQNDDAQLVAVITAAISAYIEAEESNEFAGGFRVVSFKRVQKTRTWNNK